MTKREVSMKLREFLKEHYDDYVYLSKDDGTHITDVAVKYIPYWVFRTYGGCEVKAECRKSGSNDAYCIYDVTVFYVLKSLKDVLDECISAEHVGCNVKIEDANGGVWARFKLRGTIDDTYNGSDTTLDDWQFLMTRKVLSYTADMYDIVITLVMSW